MLKGGTHSRVEKRKCVLFTSQSTNLSEELIHREGALLQTTSTLERSPAEKGFLCTECFVSKQIAGSIRTTKNRRLPPTVRSGAGFLLGEALHALRQSGRVV